MKVMKVDMQGMVPLIHVWDTGPTVPRLLPLLPLAQRAAKQWCVTEATSMLYELTTWATAAHAVQMLGLKRSSMTCLASSEKQRHCNPY